MLVLDPTSAASRKPFENTDTCTIKNEESGYNELMNDHTSCIDISDKNLTTLSDTETTRPVSSRILSLDKITNLESLAHTTCGYVNFLAFNVYANRAQGDNVICNGLDDALYACLFALEYFDVVTWLENLDGVDFIELARVLLCRRSVAPRHVLCNTFEIFVIEIALTPIQASMVLRVGLGRRGPPLLRLLHRQSHLRGVWWL